MSFKRPTIESSSENRSEVSERNKKMLLIADKISKVLKGAGLENWVLGGFSVEGYRGKVVREHHDIDFMAWGKDKQSIEQLLRENGLELKKGWTDKNSKYHEYQHKIIVTDGEIEADIGFVEYDDESGEVFPSAYPQYRFPQEFLRGEEVGLNLGEGRKATFAVPSRELLLALKIQSGRPVDQEDAELLVQQIGDQRKIKEIKEKYAFDYKKFHQAVWGE